MLRFGLLMTAAAYWCQSVKQPPKFFQKSLFLKKSRTLTRLLYSANSRKLQEEREMAAKTKTKHVQPSSLVNCHLQVIGTGGGEVPPCLFLFTDTRRYLFNCGENVQRLCHEHKVKVSKLENVFVTRVTWDNLGGLPGLAMTLRDIGVTELNIHGPRSLEGFISASQVFMDRKLLKLATLTEHANGTSFPVYSDENLTIMTVDIPFEKQFSDSDGDQSNSGSESSDTSREPQPKKAKSSSTKCFSTTAFICKLVDTPGKFNVQKATELGLPPGPNYKILKSGGSVTTKDGKVILPSDVVGPAQKGPTFVILECPRIQYISSVTTHPMLLQDAFSSTGQSLILIVHIIPPEVLDNEQYCKWMASFGPGTKHLILNGQLCPSEVGQRAIMKVQCPLHIMNPAVHHAPPTVEIEAGGTSAHVKLFEVLPKDSIIFGRIFTKYHVKPTMKVGVDNSCVLRPLEDEIAERVAAIQSNPRLTHAILHPDKPLTASADASTEYSNTQDQSSSFLIPNPTQSPILPASHLSPDDALVTFLGTGASIPSKYRNVSGILVQTPRSGCVLLDCGEGTLSQIYRCFGKKEGDDIVCNLRTIFTSHIHGDHHLGLINVLQRRAKLLRSVQSPGVSESPMEKRTVVIGPVFIGKWLREYTRNCESVPYKFINSSTLTSNSLERYEFRVLAVPVVHCKEAYGMVLEHSKGWKIVYSGDTRPCSQLVQAGKNATLLLHEATLEDDLLTEAHARKHSTISEALDIAEQMNPDFTILTHFSQRYPKVSQSLLAKGSLKSKVAIAFDCMSVHLKQLHKLPLFLPATKEIFADFEQEDIPVPVSWTD